MTHGIKAVLALISTCLCFGALWAGSAMPEFEKSDLAGVYNYTRVENSSGFAGPVAGFGGTTEPAAMPALQDEGYATVIDLRRDSEKGVDIEANRAAAEAAGLRYIHLPFNSSDPDPDLLEKFLNAAGAEENQPVYVNCGSATRVSALWMIGRVTEDGLTADQASKEVEEIAGKPESAINFATKYLAKDQE